ncbi:hypothetical protein [Nonomuraea endophytica]|uniref:Uncharacterized protein n=1 Tax=Nonomuraea endophytica TaxID=714136 RepID=A0A7W8ADR8_9ACTN|nr:hypothetical protein [Nonomuraea endophytica]MBB5083824.1 hypothetical protein [Nonomuraea endophytica]
MSAGPPVEPRAVSALWAVFGNAEGGGAGYTVLQASDDKLAFFEQEIRRYLPGTPPNRADPPPLPYYTFAPGPAARNKGAPLMSFSRLEATDILDAAGRPSIRLRYYSPTFADLVGTPGPGEPLLAGYTDLAEAMDAAPSPWSDQPHITLNVRPGGWGAIQAGVARFPFDWLASGAAALLAGRVVITGAAAVPVPERLACLDAIAGLLPFGVRASIAAATWADSAAVHQLRLYFGDTAGPEAYELRWDGTSGELSDRDARDYHALLWRCLDDGAPGDGAPTGLLEPLARQTGPFDLDSPEAIVAALRSRTLMAPEAAVKRLTGLEEDRAMVRQGLSSGRVNATNTTVEGRAACWVELVRDIHTPLDPDHLRRLDLPCSERYLHVIARGLTRVLGVPGGLGVALEYATCARSQGTLGGLLVHVLGKLRSHDPDQVGAFARLVRELGYPPELRSRLGEVDDVTVALVDHVLGTDAGQATEYVGYLCAKRPEPQWLLPLWHLLGRRPWTPPVRFADPFADIDGYEALVFAAARLGGCTEQGVGMIFPQLLEIALGDDGKSRLQPFLHLGSGPSSDALRLLVGIDAVPVTPDRIRPLHPYLTDMPALRERLIGLLTELGQALDLLDVDPELDRDLCVWMLEQETRLTRDWRVQPPDEGLRERLARAAGLNDRPGGTTDSLRRTALTDLHRAAGLAAVRRVARTGGRSQLAEAVGKALLPDLATEDLVATLDTVEAKGLDELFRRIAGTDEDLYHRLAEPVLKGLLGAERAAEFVALQHDYLLDEQVRDDEEWDRLKRLSLLLDGLCDS